ncbi:RNA polymerase sigma factor [Streptomyces sp. HK10]|uniref:RNA polymerase sigma factor n=1 Tax=Streptomyces sp. HK10 TaxID=3373255 RepID=UPI00374A7B66
MPDAGRFESFYRAHYSRLVGQLYKVTDNRYDAEEIVQEAFSRAFVRWMRLRGYDAPDAWVRRVAHNLASSRRRQAARAAHAVVRMCPPVHAEPVAPESVAVREMLAAMPEHYRQALALHYLADLPVAAVAEVLGVSANTVKTRLRRGRQTLRTGLDDEPGTGRVPRRLCAVDRGGRAEPG